MTVRNITPETNERYLVANTNSPYGIALSFNQFLLDLAKSNPANLVFNEYLINSSGLIITEWENNSVSANGAYNATSNYQALTFNNNGYLRQNIFQSPVVSGQQLQAGKDYTAILYLNNLGSSGFNVSISGNPASAQIYNLNDTSQTNYASQSVSAYDGVQKIIIQFRATSTVGNPIYLFIQNTSGSTKTLNYYYAAVYQGLIEYAYVPSKYIQNLYMQRGTALIPGLAFDVDRDTGIFSTGENNLSISTSGASRISIDNNQVDIKTNLGVSGNIAASGNATFGGEARANTVSASGAFKTFAPGFAQTLDDRYSLGYWQWELSTGSPANYILGTHTDGVNHVKGYYDNSYGQIEYSNFTSTPYITVNMTTWVNNWTALNPGETLVVIPILTRSVNNQWIATLGGWIDSQRFERCQASYSPSTKSITVYLSSMETHNYASYVIYGQCSAVLTVIAGPARMLKQMTGITLSGNSIMYNKLRIT